MPTDPTPSSAGPPAADRAADAFRQAKKVAGQPVRTFHPRRATLGERRADALERLWPRYGVSVHDPVLGLPPTTAAGALDAPALFGRTAPLVLEIGSGMGDATAAMAAADPDRDYLAVEVHLPGVANLLVLLEEQGLTNVRVAHGDALDLVRRVVAPGSLAAVHVFFPDPWPKARHHKRRIVAPEHVALLRSRLAIGGVLHCATDWEPYAEQMLDVVAADPGLTNELGGYAPRPEHRPVTRFERRALAAGRTPRDVVATRTS
ncbi:tRNA (guanosine(46)-N7)-methyltransferase TrmB [Cellulomonas sp. C5510]|uniref:tRNA (guanosine(46)-N7)-methyltransferase TrmB n=1 Tax=Cellulomonas sp. C5510 TaxID=2871170 RepID=UPI001C94DA27|nr:tRNA (guanosine(46)-N7)-methyltransferase TrmB [Cellulomonas sp. C5510]